MMEPAVIYEYEKEQNRIDTLRVNNAYYDMFGYGDINSSGGLVMEKQLSDESRKILLGTFEDIAKVEGDRSLRIFAHFKERTLDLGTSEAEIHHERGRKAHYRRYAYRYYGTADDGSGTGRNTVRYFWQRKRQSGRCWLWMIRR